MGPTEPLFIGLWKKNIQKFVGKITGTLEAYSFRVPNKSTLLFYQIEP